jgi:hypothetical protein
MNGYFAKMEKWRGKKAPLTKINFMKRQAERLAFLFSGAGFIPCICQNLKIINYARIQSESKT